MARRSRSCLALLAAALAFGAHGVARAEPDLFSPDLFSQDAFHGLADIRLGAADGERSWLDGGSGKTAISGGRGQFDVSQAVLEWRPQFNFALSGVISAQLQPQVSPRLDLDEAYLVLKAPPVRWGRLQARAGVFYPPVSEENTGVGWTTPDMLSGSAVDTWIGEEVKVGGVELSWKGALGAHQLEAAAGLFGWNDTAGTLLTFRGWATDEVRTGILTSFELPPLSPFAGHIQDDETYPFRGIARRAGYYAHLEWRPPAPVSFNALYYDNRGDRRSVDAEDQWSWATRFTDIGMRWEIGPDTHLLAQALRGSTAMGFVTPGGIWFDTDFQAAYALVSHRLPAGDTLSLRLDAFQVRDRTLVSLDNNNETGWAATATWRRPLTRHADLIVEVERIASDRPARALAGVAPRQDQTVGQTALRLSF